MAMEFPPPHIHAPQTTHTHTIILLHGRASDGPEFAEELFSSLTTKGTPLPDCLPSWRWVFPTSRDRWSALFQEEMCSWFDAYSLTNIDERQELQIEGLQESVSHILDLLENEIRLLDGKAGNVFLGGISQGMATALWTVFCAAERIPHQIGGLVGFCGWLPFANRLEELIAARSKEKEEDATSPTKTEIQRLVSNFCLATIDSAHAPPTIQENNSSDSGRAVPILTTPVLLGHGTDDVWVPVELGQQAFRVVQQVMWPVEWQEYTGAEGEGHWIKEPEGFDHILRFLKSRSIGG
ncbi:Alpha/Beta hydrolase protein [Aspergillus pseudoustus]|uniref:Alpha/Beta hydrolase protein n=1 Tax=Aspergillus pseudoustus TaxID=1810923 RepID=A0ABR4J0Q2_9EURO